MTDDELESRARKGYLDGGTIGFLLRRLDESRAEISRLRAANERLHGATFRPPPEFLPGKIPRE